jgi:hypothetical protein
MTESEWASAVDPTKMLGFLRLKGQLTVRKTHLFAAAVCRDIWHELTDARSRAAVEAVEQYAEGVISEPQFQEAWVPALEAKMQAHEAAVRGGGWVVMFAAEAASEAMAGRLRKLVEAAAWAGMSRRRGREGMTRRGQVAWTRAAWKGNRRCQCDLLRDIFGPLPFRPVSIEASWRSPDVLSIARRVYEKRSFNLMPVLGAALSDTGCTDPEVLGHCGGPGPHARGCWVVDLLLGQDESTPKLAQTMAELPMADMTLQPDDQQRQALGRMLHHAFVEIRALGWAGRAQQAADLADAFHNLPTEVYVVGRLNVGLFRRMLRLYQEKYPSEGDRLYDYVAMLDSIFTCG